MTDVGEFRIPATMGKAARVAAGRQITVVNTHGTQVLDTWAFDAEDLRESMSMAHSRSFNSRITAIVGMTLVSDRRRPMLTIVKDTSPGIHDTLLCACNRRIYEELGVPAYHRNCEDNLHEALRDLGLAASGTPDPLNLFMNIPVREDGRIDRLPPASKPGDYVVLRAEADLVIAFSACPQDVTPINGAECKPRDAHFRID